MTQIISKKPLAMTASLACVIHCLVTPILVSAAPVMGVIIKNPMIEIGVLIGSIVMGMMVIHSGYCTHKKKHTIALFSVGAVLWIAHSLIEHFEWVHWHGLLAIGTGFVLIAYWANHRYLSCCGGCSSQAHGQ